MQRAEIKLQPDRAFVAPAVDFVDSFAGHLGVEETRREELRHAFEQALALVMEKNQAGVCDEPVGVNVEQAEGKLTVRVLNRGVPIFYGTDTGYLALIYEAATHLDRLAVENNGREGQSLVFQTHLGREAAQRALPFVEHTASAAEESGHEESGREEIELRPLRRGEAEALSQLFYLVYGYNYINEFVYYPEQLRKMLSDGTLTSMGAFLPSGRLVAHVGLRKWASAPPVYEPCLGVVDPTVKSQGLFSRVFNRAMRFVGETPMQYCFVDTVTNHDFSQRMVTRYGGIDVAIFVGAQSSKTQARLARIGIGADPAEMDRYSILFSLIPRVEHPFGREITLPDNLGELLGFLLEPLNLQWIPASRFNPLAVEGEYHAVYQPPQQAVIFDLLQPGRAAVQRLLGEWVELRRSGFQYAAVDVPVDHHGLGTLYDILAEQGFFISGFLPYRHSDRLAVRFQATGPTRVAFDKIKVYSNRARRLLEAVQQDYERNVFL